METQKPLCITLILKLHEWTNEWSLFIIINFIIWLYTYRSHLIIQVLLCFTVLNALCTLAHWKRFSSHAVFLVRFSSGVFVTNFLQCVQHWPGVVSSNDFEPAVGTPYARGPVPWNMSKYAIDQRGEKNSNTTLKSRLEFF